MRRRATTTTVLALGLGVAIGYGLGDRSRTESAASSERDDRPGPRRATVTPPAASAPPVSASVPNAQSRVAPAPIEAPEAGAGERPRAAPASDRDEPDMLVSTAVAPTIVVAEPVSNGALDGARATPSPTHTTELAPLPAGFPVRRDTRGRARPTSATDATDAPDEPLPEADHDAVVTCDRADPDAPLGAFEACLATRLGEPVWSGVLPADDLEGLHIPAPDACAYLLVVEGVFAYSATGRQDALRRWHEPLAHDFEPLCTACGADENEALIAFVIDGVARRPLAECPLSHAYVYDVTPVDGAIHVAINDYSLSYGMPRHDDNEGGLRVTLHAVPVDHELRVRYLAEGHVLGTPVASSLGVQRLGFEPGGTPTAMLLRFPELARFVRQVAWPVDPLRRYVIELRGFATVARGIEADVQYRWPPLDALSRSFAITGCASTTMVDLDLYAHRYAFEVSGCTPVVTVTSLVERLAGVIQVELYER